MKKIIIYITLLSTFSLSYSYMPIKIKYKDIFFENTKEEHLNKHEINFRGARYVLNCLSRSNSFKEEEFCLNNKIEEKFKKIGFKEHKKLAMNSFVPVVNIADNFKKCLDKAMNMIDIQECHVKSNLSLQKLIKSEQSKIK